MALPGENLRLVRKSLGKTTYQMAELLGMPQGTYSKWENGSMEIKVSGLAKLYIKTGAMPNFVCSSIPPMFEGKRKEPDLNEMKAEQLSMIAKLDYLARKV